MQLSNIGRGSAQAICIDLSLSKLMERKEYGVDGNRGEGLPLIRAGGPADALRYAAGSDVVLHPGMTLRLCRQWVGFEHAQRLAKMELPSE